MNGLHEIGFILNEDVSLRVLYAITESYCCPKMVTDNWGNCEFRIVMDKESAMDLYDRFGWAMIEVCDMDQEDGGSFI